MLDLDRGRITVSAQNSSLPPQVRPPSAPVEAKEDEASGVNAGTLTYICMQDIWRLYAVGGMKVPKGLVGFSPTMRTLLT